MKLSLGLVCLLGAWPLLPASPPLHVTIVSHNEEPSGRSVDYLSPGEPDGVPAQPGTGTAVGAGDSSERGEVEFAVGLELSAGGGAI